MNFTLIFLVTKGHGDILDLMGAIWQQQFAQKKIDNYSINVS